MAAWPNEVVLVSFRAGRSTSAGQSPYVTTKLRRKPRTALGTSVTNPRFVTRSRRERKDSTGVTVGFDCLVSYRSRTRIPRDQPERNRREPVRTISVRPIHCRNVAPNRMRDGLSSGVRKLPVGVKTRPSSPLGPPPRASPTSSCDPISRSEFPLERRAPHFDRSSPRVLRLGGRAGHGPP